ncbi:MAG: type IV pilus modification protein PilV [Betaproteobacteria bacterium]|nr:MAG: type IV pilus modification protein PilV [Betaproteobacteria bacterium]
MLARDKRSFKTKGFLTPGNERLRGFSLLEVLITIVVVAIGLLGVAGMQVAALKLTDLSSARSTGAVLTSEIIERMRANSGEIASYAAGFGAAVTGSTLAATDVAAWKARLADPIRGVPGGEGRIEIASDTSGVCPAAPPFPSCQLVTVTVRWSEQRVRGGEATPREFVTVTRI